MPTWLEAGLWGLLGGRRARHRRPDRLVHPRPAQGRRVGDGLRLRRAHLRGRLRPHGGGGDTGGLVATAFGFLGGAVVYLAANLLLARRGARHASGRGSSSRRSRSSRAAGRPSRSERCSTASPSPSSWAGPAGRSDGEPVGAGRRVHLQRARGAVERRRHEAQRPLRPLRLRRLGRHRVASGLAALLGYVPLGGAARRRSR